MRVRRRYDFWEKDIASFQYRLCDEETNAVIATVSVDLLFPVDQMKIETLVYQFGSIPQDYFFRIPDDILALLPDSILDVVC